MRKDELPYRKAADQGLAEAQSALGEAYLCGYGVSIDPVESFRWFLKAAEKGHAMAEFNVGTCFDNGLGVAKDEIEATKWYRKPAEKGVADAQYNLGINYAFGTGGLARDAVESVKWYLRAAEQNFAMAQCNLSVRLCNGDGIVKDYLEAYKWALLAAAQGNDYARTNLSEFLESKLTPGQIAEGQGLARNYKPRAASGRADNSSRSLTGTQPESTGSGFFVTQNGYLISNYHVVKAGNEIRIVTSSGLVAARVVKVDAANDLALLRAQGSFSSLPIASSRAVKLGGTVATVGFPNIGLQGFAPKLARARSRRCPARGMTRGISKSACRCSRAIRAGRWWTSAATWWAWRRPS